MRVVILTLLLCSGCTCSAEHLAREARILLREPHQGGPQWEHRRRIFLEDCVRVLDE